MSGFAHLLDRDETGLVMATIPDPAVGADFAWVVPEYTNILPISLTFKLVTAAAATQRHVHVAGRLGGTYFCIAAAPGHQDASSTCRYDFALCVLGIDEQTVHNFQTATLPQAMILKTAEELVSNVQGLDAADQISEIELRYLQKLPR